MNWGHKMFACIVVVAAVLALTGSWTPQPVLAADRDLGPWSAGGAVGFLGSTPDGLAMAFNVNGELFLNPSLSLGPLMQIAFTDELSQIGLSAQVKYWLGIPDTDSRLKVTVQAGIGFVHADFLDGDTSWLIPLGIGVDYALTNRIKVFGTLLLDLTSLDTGSGTGARAMTGITVGVRF